MKQYIGFLLIAILLVCSCQKTSEPFSTQPPIGTWTDSLATSDNTAYFSYKFNSDGSYSRAYVVKESDSEINAQNFKTESGLYTISDGLMTLTAQSSYYKIRPKASSNEALKLENNKPFNLYYRIVDQENLLQLYAPDDLENAMIELKKMEEIWSESSP